MNHQTVLEVKTIIEDKLRSFGDKFDFFLGGSRRFGWDNVDSDLDYMVLFRGSDEDEYFLNVISNLGAIRQTSNYGNQHWRTFVFGVQVDLIVFFINSIEQYKNLRIEHTLIEKEIWCFPPKVNQLLSLLHAQGVPGKQIYRGVRDLLRGY